MVTWAGTVASVVSELVRSTVTGWLKSGPWRYRRALVALPSETNSPPSSIERYGPSLSSTSRSMESAAADSFSLVALSYGVAVSVAICVPSGSSSSTTYMVNRAEASPAGMSTLGWTTAAVGSELVSSTHWS